MLDDPLIREAERKVAERALAWAQTPTDHLAAELRSAVFMLRKAREITGKERIDEVIRELDAAERMRSVPSSIFVVIDLVLGPTGIGKDLVDARNKARPGQCVAEYRAFRRY